MTDETKKYWHYVAISWRYAHQREECTEYSTYSFLITDLYNRNYYLVYCKEIAAEEYLALDELYN